jgi:hypothetical protein
MTNPGTRRNQMPSIAASCDFPTAIDPVASKRLDMELAGLEPATS